MTEKATTKGARSRLAERNPAAATESRSFIVIALASAKGGTGKTTLAIALAAQAFTEGARVALVDWEPQGSLSLWWHMRGKSDNPHLIEGVDDPVEAVRDLGGKYDWAFIDTAPAAMDQIEQAVEAADFVLIPVQASAFDLMAARAVVAMCGESGTPFAFVLNREHGRRETLNNSAATHLRNLGVLLPETVRDLAAHVSALNRGKAGIEHPDGNQAQDVRKDIEPLWAKVKVLAIKAGASTR